MSTTQNIHTKMEDGLFWAPRSLGMIGILFMLIFSYESLWDVYNLSGWELIFYAHIIPAVIIAALLYISWNHETFGAVSFIILSVISLIVLQAGNSVNAAILIAFPLLFIGVLFLIHSSEYDFSISKTTDLTDIEIKLG